MALPTLLARPEKDIPTGYLEVISRFNASALPIQYQIENDKWPTASDPEYNIVQLTEVGGYTQFRTNAANGYLAGQSVKITVSGGNPAYNGIWQIIEIIDTDEFLTNAPYIIDESDPFGVVQRYYQNYTTLVNVYAGLPTDHPLYLDKPIELIGTIQQKPNSDNITYVDVRKYIKSKLNTVNDINQDSFPCDINLFTGFYIEWAERYDDVDDGEVVNFTSDYTSDEADPCYATFSALQFRNERGGNMMDYMTDGDQFRDVAGKFMTKFTRPKLFEGKYFDIAIINGGFNQTINAFNSVIKEYNINGELVMQQGFLVTNYSPCVYRFRLDNRTFNAETSYFTFETGIESQVITIDLDRRCLPNELPLTWVNSLGGWDHWVFTARKSYSFEMSNVQTIKRDIFQDWDTEFISGQSESEHISMRAAQTVIVRSQNLTAQQAEAIAQVKYSIKVQDMTDPDNPVTVLVDKGSITYTTDKAKTNFIEFAITYPSIIIQEQ